jgi:uncharacterized membrane protein YphA (DoxX/SURF4 family)
MITVTWTNGFLGGGGESGYQVNVLLIGLAVVIALIGPGRFALDAAIGASLERNRPKR